MKRGLDTNVLICSHIPALPEHERVRNFLLRELEHEDVTLVLTPHVLHEFIHVVTDTRRFDPPVTMGEALAVARLYLGRINVECAVTDAGVLIDAFDLLERHNLGRSRIADTLFAATLLHHGVSELITCNPADFRVFEELRLVDPREPVRSSAP